MKKIFLILICSLFLLKGFPDEKIVDFDKESIPILNEELKKIRDDFIWRDDTTNDEIELKKDKDLDMQQKELKNMAIENRTDDPSEPVTGQMWFRTDI